MLRHYSVNCDGLPLDLAQLLANDIGEGVRAHAIRADDIGGVIALAEGGGDRGVDAVGSLRHISVMLRTKPAAKWTWTRLNRAGLI